MLRGSALLELTRQRVLAFLRRPEAVFWVFAFPLVLAAVLGFAFKSGKAASSRIALLEESSVLFERLEGAPNVELELFSSRVQAELALRNGHVDVLVLEGEPPVLRLDAARQEAEVARLRVLVAISEVESDRLALDEVTERGSRYIDFLFPGLLGMNLMGTGLWAIGFAVADMRQRKVLKRFLVTPMRRSSFLGSFLLARLVFLVLEVVCLTLFAVWVLDVPFRAGLLQYATLCLFGAIGFAGLGLLAASRVKTTEGVSGMLNFVMMPMWLCSGVFFSYERFPDAIHPVLRLLPLTAMNDALRATMLEGAGFGQILPELGVLLFWTVVPFFLALKLFRWS